MTALAELPSTGTGHLFPRFHLRPPVGYLNDPNGPVVLDGVTHLFFQHRETTDLEGPVRWGHASSADLVRWTLHAPALLPRAEHLDQDGCWSGNVVVDDDGRLRAFYSGLRLDHPYQSVLCAVSTDGGASFGEPVLAVADPAPAERIVTFRDPFVWRDGDGWLMVVGSGDADGVAAVRLYASADLERWRLLGDLARSPRLRDGSIDTGEMWECPQVLDLDGQLRLLVGAWTRVDGTMRVYSLTTPPPGGPPGELVISPLDDGPDFYAASVLRTSRAGTVVWGWVREARDHAWCQQDGWSGAISLPRVARAHPSGRIALDPHPALQGLRSGAGVAVGPGGVSGLPAQLELEARTPGGALRMLLTFGENEHLEITLDADVGTVGVDRSAASADPRAAGGTVLVEDAVDPGEDARVRVFLDGSILELFTGSGRVATLRCYPTAAPPYRIDVTGPPAATVRLWMLDPPT